MSRLVYLRNNYFLNKIILHPPNLVNLSTHSTSVPFIQSEICPKTRNTILSSDETNEFMEIFPQIVHDLTENQKDIPELNEHLANALVHNVFPGRKHRACTLIAAYKMLEKPEKLTPNNIRLANMLGWCVEVMEASFTLTDDIIDGSNERHDGHMCWYKKEDVGLNAINDALYFSYATNYLLKTYFARHPSYMPMMEFCSDVALRTIKGLMLDCFKHNGQLDFQNFTMERYETIATTKGSYYTFEMPAILALHLANVYEPDLHKQVHNYAMDIGLFYQIENDCWDAFSPAGIGEDIRDGRCSWLAVMALQKANEIQRNVMKQYYGQENPQSVQTIINLYRELELPKIFNLYKDESFDKLYARIRNMDKRLPQQAFVAAAEYVYERSF